MSPRRKHPPGQAMTIEEYRALEREGEFLRKVIEYAELHRWRVCHFHDSRREVVDKRTGERRLVGDSRAAGFPDLVLVRKHRLIFAELKAEGQTPTDEQAAWLAALHEVSTWSTGAVQVYTWRPHDWPEIDKVLF
jgi:hypothetical protein